MYTIETASGTTHEVEMCGAADNCLHIHILDGDTFMATAEEFDDSENTRTITFRYGEMETVHEGYTSLISIFWDGGGRYNIMLKKQN